MITKSQRLRVLVKVTDRIQLDAAKAMVEYRRNLRNAELKMSQLLEYRQEYATRLNSTPGGFQAAQIKSYHQFLSKLNEAVSCQREQVERIRHVYEEKCAAWYLAQRKSAAADKMSLKHHQLQTHMATRREQHESDECAQQLFLSGGRVIKPPHA